MSPFSKILLTRAPTSPEPSYTGPLGVHVILKVTHLASLLPPHNAEREVRILRKAAGPNVIELWDSIYDGRGNLVLVLPFLPLSLEYFVGVPGKMGGRERDGVKRCLGDMFRGLAHIHSMGVIHRDVKPGNILLASRGGPAYLADFGIAWSPTDPVSEPADKKITDVGTTCYRPPEVLFGSTTYDSSYDLWAAGCVVAEVLSGKGEPLFDSGDLGTDLRLVQSIFESLGTPNKEIWPELAIMPDWGRLNFHERPRKSWTDLLPNASSVEMDLVDRLVQYPGGKRLKADMVGDFLFDKYSSS
jgi:serine/threonine protein kinase